MTSEGSGLDLQPWEVVSRERLVDATPWMQVWRETVRLPDGRVIDDYFTVDQPDHVMVFAVTAERRVICLWHYKHGPRSVNLSFPAGYISDPEQPLDASLRELLEETGFRAKEWSALGSFTVDGNRGNGRAHYFFARDAEQVAEPVSDDLEEVRIEFVPIPELWRRLSTSVRTLDAAALIGLATAHLGEG